MNNIQYRKDNHIKIFELINSNYKILKILDDNKKNILDESSFNSKLINLISFQLNKKLY